MTDEEIRTVLKVDLQISTDRMDVYLDKVIDAAKSYIQTEGIQLTCSTGDGMLVENVCRLPLPPPERGKRHDAPDAPLGAE